MARIRDALPEDAPKLLALRHQLFAETNFMLHGPDEGALTLDELSLQIDKLSNAPTSRALVAEIEESLVGFLNINGSPVPRIRHCAHLAMGVSRSSWGRGIGTSLMKEAFRWAPTVGVSRLELSVMASNSRAIALYQRLGFKSEGLRRRAYIVNGVPIDDHVMGYVFEV